MIKGLNNTDIPVDIIADVAIETANNSRLPNMLHTHVHTIWSLHNLHREGSVGSVSSEGSGECALYYWEPALKCFNMYLQMML
jgi:hypothetical protein